MTQKALLDSYRHGVLEEQRRELEQRMKMAVKESEDKVVEWNDRDVILYLQFPLVTSTT